MRKLLILLAVGAIAAGAASEYADLVKMPDLGLSKSSAMFYVEEEFPEYKYEGENDICVRYVRGEKPKEESILINFNHTGFFSFWQRYVYVPLEAWEYCGEKMTLIMNEPLLIIENTEKAYYQMKWSEDILKGRNYTIEMRYYYEKGMLSISKHTGFE